jgi:hypothetical protein
VEDVLLAGSNVLANENWFESNISCCLGCGDDIKLWYDNWICCIPLKEEYSELFKCAEFEEGVVVEWRWLCSMEVDGVG